MGLATAVATEISPEVSEMPRTPRKRPGGAGRNDLRQVKTGSPRQQPQLQNNIDRYFQPTPPQSPQSEIPTVKESPEKVNNTANNDSTSDEANKSNEVPQKENVPDTETVMPPSRKGQTKRATSVRQTADVKGQGKSRSTPKRPTKQTSQQRQDTKSVSSTTTEELNEKKDVKRITDYFQLRRSHRKTKGEVIKCKQMLMEEKVLHEDESGFQVVKFEDKGRGVVSNVDLSAGDFVLEYAGDLIDLKEARRREEE